MSESRFNGKLAKLEKAMLKMLNLDGPEYLLYPLFDADNMKGYIFFTIEKANEYQYCKVGCYVIKEDFYADYDGDWTDLTIIDNGLTAHNHCWMEVVKKTIGQQSLDTI